MDMIEKAVRQGNLGGASAFVRQLNATGQLNPVRDKAHAKHGTLSSSEPTPSFLGRRLTHPPRRRTLRRSPT